MRADYPSWLQGKGYVTRTCSSRLSELRRVEAAYGSIDEIHSQGRLNRLLAQFEYSSDDKRTHRPNPTRIPINGDVHNSLATYRSAINLYREFLKSAVR